MGLIELTSCKFSAHPDFICLNWPDLLKVKNSEGKLKFAKKAFKDFFNINYFSLSDLVKKSFFSSWSGIVDKHSGSPQGKNIPTSSAV